jgi:hypothetical protein
MPTISLEIQKNISELKSFFNDLAKTREGSYGSAKEEDVLLEACAMGSSRPVL